MKRLFNKDPIAVLQNMLEIQRRRKEIPWHTAPKDTPPDEREKSVIKKIESQIVTKAEKAGNNQASAQFETLRKTYGEREIMNLFIEPIKIYGVSYAWFAANTIFCLVAFMATQNFHIFLLVQPALHIVGCCYYSATRKHHRDKKIQSIITQGIKI